MQEAHNELEKRVVERTSYLNALIENSPLAILVLDSEQKVQLCNPAFESLFQCARKEAIGKPVVELFPNEKSLPEVEALISERHPNRTRVSLTTRRKRKDGSYVDVELHLVPLTVQWKSARLAGHLSGRDGAASAGAAAPHGPEDGGRRPAFRRNRPRFQQSPRGYPRLHSGHQTQSGLRKFPCTNTPRKLKKPASARWP